MKKFSYTTIPATGNRTVKGATIEQLHYAAGYGQYHIGGRPVMQVIREGESTLTAGGASTVGYQIEGKPGTRQPSLKKLIASLT